MRDTRTQLLLKLALLDLIGGDPADLLTRQRAVLEPIVRAIEATSARQGGFDTTLLAWRKANGCSRSISSIRSLALKGRFRLPYWADLRCGASGSHGERPLSAECVNRARLRP